MKAIDRYSPLYEALTLALAPLATWAVLHFVPINQDSYIDPWFYTGYGRIFPVMQAQFGWPYYAARFPVVGLNEAASLLPPVVGYVALRYLLLLACGFPLYVWARRSFGRGVALFSYAFLFWNPLLPRILFWDLTTFVSVPLALAGAAVWLASDPGTPRTRFAAGALWMASSAAHVFTVTAIAVFVLVESIRRIRNRQIRGLLLDDLLPTAAGATVCVALGLIYYWVRIGPFVPMTLLAVTLQALGAGNAYAGSHRTAVLLWAPREYHIYVPLLCLIFSALLLRRRLLDNSRNASVWWFAAAYTGFYLVYQLVFGRFVLESFYYFAHLTIVVFLLVPVILSELATAVPVRSRGRVLGAMAVALVLIPLANRFALQYGDRIVLLATGNLALTASLVTVGLLLTATARWVVARRFGAVIVGVIFVLLVQTFTFLNVPHRQVFDPRREARETDVYRAALSMLDVFGAYDRPRTSVVLLWFCERQSSLASIASSVLLFTLHQSFNEGRDACDSRLGEYERSRLKNVRPAYLMMLDETGASFPLREASLREEGYEPRAVVSRTIGGHNYHAALRLVRLERLLSSEEQRVLSLPSTPLVHWNGDDLRAVGSPNLYAEHPVESLTRASNGSWTFHPATDRDHFATPYIPVPSTISERWVRIEVKGAPGAGDNCVLHAQTQQYESIGDVPCGAAMASDLPVVLPVSAGVTAIRMFVADPQLAPIVLPRDISVKLYSREAAVPIATGQR